MHHQVSHEYISLNQFKSLFESDNKLEISSESKHAIQKSRRFLLDKLGRSEKPIYGINTGFGSLCKEEIGAEDLGKLQINLVRSHACGVGPKVPDKISRLIFLLKIRNFLSGHSGVSLELATQMVAMYNTGAAPVIFEKGSLGASGDLVPLAHLSLPLLGEGEVVLNQRMVSGKEALELLNMKPFVLAAKEGLALLNGTQFMLAYGLDSLWRAQSIMNNAMAVFALAMDAFDCRTDFLHSGIHQIRPHKGQIRVAQYIDKILSTSQIAHREKIQVQDPYSIRCVPQVLGASWDTIDYVASVFETELNSITDNPNVFEDLDLVISGGNFHGQPLALALDFLSIAVAEVANIAERLLYKIIAGERGLPPFLTQNPGLESGFMIPQYAAAALVSQNKQLATPASVDSIVSSNGQEDHVSMGANAGLKCNQIVANTESVLGILLLAAMQALDFRRPLQTGSELETLYADFRKLVPFRGSDSVFKPDMDAATQFLRNLQFEPESL